MKVTKWKFAGGGVGGFDGGGCIWGDLEEAYFGLQNKT